MNEQPTPNFPGIGAPATDFFAVRANLRTPPLYTSIDLTSARAKSANTQQVLTITGNFIYCDPALSTGVATGYFVGLDNNATPITLYPGAAFDVPFTSIVIENTAQPGASLRLVYGTDIAFRPANAAGVSILNAISVIDAGYQRTLQAIEYAAGIYSPAVAAQGSRSQLWNPVGSTVNLVLRKTGVNSAGSQQLFMYRIDTALANIYAGGAVNKYLGNTASQAELRYDSNAAPATNAVGNTLSAMFDGATGVHVPNETLTAPFVIPPGKGVMWAGFGLNIAIYGQFDWYEQAR